MNLARIWACVGWIAAAVAAGPAFAPAFAADIKIGFANGDSADYAPPFAAEKLGLFKAAGLDVQLIAFRGGAPAQEAMSAGAVDIVTYLGPGVALAVSKGAREKMVATIEAGHTGWQLIVRSNSPITDLKGLAGKKVGISTKATTSDIAGLWLAEHAGISFQQVPVGAGALIPSLRSGQVDAIIFSALLTQREVITGRARSLFDIGRSMEPTLANVYTASQEMIDQRPDELRKVLAVIWQAQAYMAAHRAWSLDFLKEFAKSDNEAVTVALYEGIVLQLSPDGAIEPQWVENGLKLAARAWDVPELASMDPNALFTNAFHPTAVH